MAGTPAHAPNLNFNAINRHNMNNKNALRGLATAVVLQLEMLASFALRLQLLLSGKYFAPLAPESRITSR